MNYDRQITSIEFLYAELYKRITVWDSMQGNKQVYIVLNSGDLIRLINEAKEMYRDEIEAAAIISSATSATSAASANTEAFADGYRQGYNRALELSKWAISNLVPPHNEKK